MDGVAVGLVSKPVFQFFQPFFCSASARLWIRLSFAGIKIIINIISSDRFKPVRRDNTDQDHQTADPETQLLLDKPGHFAESVESNVCGDIAIRLKAIRRTYRL